MNTTQHNGLLVSQETIAILEAILYIDCHKISKCLIFSDSSRCLQDFIKQPFQSKNKFTINLQIKEALYRCHCAKIQLSLAWIPGYNGVSSMKVVDSFAKDAIRIGMCKQCVCRCAQVLSQRSTCYVHSHMLASWLELWQVSRRTVGKHYVCTNNVQPNLPIKPWF